MSCEGWKDYHWGDLVTLEYGKGLKNYKDNVNGVPVYGTNGLIGYTSEALCKHNGIIIGRKGAYRGVQYSSIPFYVIDTAFYVEIKKSSLVDYKWAYYQISTYDINSMDSGSAIPSTSREDFYNLPVKLPPITEQKDIAATLSCLDNKIELNNRMNKILEVMTQAIFKSWFVDFEPFQDGEFVDSELGPIPKGWKVGTVSDLGSVVGGSTPSKNHKEYYIKNGLPWITPKDLSISKNKFIERGKIDITPVGLKNSSAKIMPRGTILFSSRAPIGYIAIAEGNVTTNQGFKSVVPNRNTGTAFLYCFLKHNVNKIINMAFGSTFKEISGSSMKNVPALVPDGKIIEKFSKICDILFAYQEKLEAQNEKLALIRDALIPKLIHGDI